MTAAAAVAAADCSGARLRGWPGHPVTQLFALARALNAWRERPMRRVIAEQRRRLCWPTSLRPTTGLRLLPTPRLAISSS